MNKILDIINEWDPIHLMSHSPDDEYINEVNMIEKELVKINDIEVLSNKILEIFKSQFGEEDFKCDIIECRRIAKLILQSLK